MLQSLSVTPAAMSPPKRRRRIKFGSFPQAPVNYREGRVTVLRNNNEIRYSLWYRVYNPLALPRQNTTCHKAPIVVVHGGPSLPSDYLHPIAGFTSLDRAIIFYDQLGCGNSDQPSQDTQAYSIEQSVQDLEALVKALDLESFHLLGHSYGGVLAFEYMKKQQQQRVLAAHQNQNHNQTTSYNNPRNVVVAKSLILSNTPTSFAESSEEHARLLLELQQLHAPDLENHGSTTEEELRRLEQLFFETHECRTPRTPEPLARAIRKCHGAAWSSAHQDIFHYHAATHASEHNIIMNMPPTLLIRGEYDFVTESCTRSWFDILGRPLIWKETILSNCAHYPHLEDGARYGTLLEDHCSSLEKVQDKRPISQQGAIQICS